MAYPQGINFRSTAGYVTDGTGEDYEIGPATDYPRTTAQGNTVGWEEDGGGNLQPRNRNSGNDRRLAGYNGCSATGTIRFRFDLPSAGTYNIRVAAGDANYTTTVDTELLDTTTSLGVLTSGSTGAANSFKAADNTAYTAANWVTNIATHTLPFTFSTTICRFRCSTASTTTCVMAHAYVEAGAASGGLPFFMQSDLLNGGTQSLAGGFQ